MAEWNREHNPVIGTLQDDCKRKLSEVFVTLSMCIVVPWLLVCGGRGVGGWGCKKSTEYMTELANLEEKVELGVGNPRTPQCFCLPTFFKLCYPATMYHQGV